MRLKERVAVITGAGSGMGRAGATLFAEEGAEVVVADIDLDAAEKVVGEITEAGGKAWAQRCDVSSMDELRGLYEAIESRHGALHVVWNHAGVPGSPGLDIDEEEFGQAIDINLRSAWFGTTLALPLLKKTGGGSIIYTASVSGLVGSPRAPLYSTAKGGIVAMMRGVALKLAADGIRANAICPGPVDTPMLPIFLGGGGLPGSTDDPLKSIKEAVPLGRPGTAKEIAQAGLFLASDESSFITGVALPVDGGYVAR